MFLVAENPGYYNFSPILGTWVGTLKPIQIITFVVHFCFTHFIFVFKYMEIEDKKHTIYDSSN